MGQRNFIRDTQSMANCPGCGGQGVSVYRHPPANARRDDYAESTRCSDPSCNRLLRYSPTTRPLPGTRDYDAYSGRFSTYNEPARERGVSMVMPR
jgi:hypothetical protein